MSAVDEIHDVVEDRPHTANTEVPLRTNKVPSAHSAPKSVGSAGTAPRDNKNKTRIRDLVLARCSSGIHRAGFVREFLTYVSPLQFRC